MDRHQVAHFAHLCHQYHDAICKSLQEHLSVPAIEAEAPRRLARGESSHAAVGMSD